MAVHRLTLLTAAALAAATLQTPSSAQAGTPPTARALELYRASAEAAYYKATAADATSYDVTGCTVTRSRGECAAHLFGQSNLGWVRSDFTIRGTWHAGRLSVTTGPDHWRLTGKRSVYEDTWGTGARRRGLSR